MVRRLALVLAAFLAAGVMAAVAAGSSGSSPPPTAQPAGGGASGSAPAAPSIPTATLYDQNDNFGDNGFASSSALDTQASDDFVVPASTTWHITSVFVPGSDFLDLTSVTVTIYSDSSGSPGSQVYTVTVPSGSFTDDPGSLGYPGGTLTIPIDATLSAGHYWLSVQGNGDVWYWDIRTVVSNTAAMWQNPNGIFNPGCTTWTDAAACFFYDTGTLDYMFTLYGTLTVQYAGTPGQKNCIGKTTSALSDLFNGDLAAAAQALGFTSVKALNQDIKQYCSA